MTRRLPQPNRRTAAMRRHPRLGQPEFTDLGLILVVLLLVTASLSWVGAVLAGLLTHQAVPDGGLVPAVMAFGSLMDPAAAWPVPEQLPGPVAYWSCTLLVVATVGGLVWWRRDLVGDLVAGAASSGPAPGALPGMARWRDLRPLASRRAVEARAAVLRPASTTTAASRPPVVGYRIGSLRGQDVWCTVEDSVLLVGPPRMGKGVHVVIPWVLDAPGAVVATSTRPDTLAVTLAARRRCGPVAVFDPQQLAGLPGGLAWSPVRGCEDPRTALVRARGLAAGAGWGASVSDAAFWAGQTETTLRCLLHAAALDGRRAPDLYRWSLQPTLAQDAVRVLTRHPDAADGWADALEAVVHADPRTRDSVWLGVRQALASLADPRVLAAVDPEVGEGFDPARFLIEAGTLFLLAPATTSASSGPLVAAFVEDVTETARRRAAASIGARLDPPVLLALDEIANLTPLPSLPALMAEGGGSGITTMAVLQSLAQARHRWGEHAADAIWDAATVKLVLGGLAHRRDLDDVTRLLGEIDEPTPTISRSRAGDRATSTSLRQVPVMPPAVLRTLPFGTAVLLLRHTPPAVLTLQPWTARADAAALAAGRAAVEKQIRRRTP